MSHNGAEYEYYRRIKLLGEGAFGKAYLVECLSDGSKCVIKQMDLNNMSEEEKRETYKEAHILEALKHPNIIRFREVYRTKQSKLCIVMDYADGGDLGKLIKEAKGTRFSENQILDWFTQICLALKHVHDRKILHRDLKSQNIFLTKENTIKLGDFGIARVLSNTKEKAKTIVGTPYYLSPEIIENVPYSFKSDIWSLGIILYELCNLEPPFNAESLSCLALRIVRGNYAPVSNYYSKDLRNLVGCLLQNDVNKRPTVHQILKMPVITNRIKNFLTESVKSFEFSHTIFHNKKFVDLKDKQVDFFQSPFQIPNPKGFVQYPLSNNNNLNNKNPNAFDYMPSKKDSNNYYVSPKNELQKIAPNPILERKNSKNDDNKIAPPPLDRKKYAISPSVYNNGNNPFTNNKESLNNNNNNKKNFDNIKPPTPNQKIKENIFNIAIPPNSAKNKDEYQPKTPASVNREIKEKNSNKINDDNNDKKKKEVIVAKSHKKKEENKKNEDKDWEKWDIERKKMLNDIEIKRSLIKNSNKPSQNENVLIEWVGPIKPSENKKEIDVLEEEKNNKFSKNEKRKEEKIERQSEKFEKNHEKSERIIEKSDRIIEKFEILDKIEKNIEKSDKLIEKSDKTTEITDLNEKSERTDRVLLDPEISNFDNIIHLPEKQQICNDEEMSQILIELQEIVNGNDDEDLENSPKIEIITEAESDEREDDSNDLKEQYVEEILDEKTFVKNNLKNLLEGIFGAENFYLAANIIKEELKNKDLFEFYNAFGHNNFQKILPFLNKEEIDKNGCLLFNYILLDN